MKKRKSQLPKALKQWRGSTSQVLAANSLDVPLATYRNWEQGRNIPAPMVESSLLNQMKRLVQITEEL